MATAFENLEKLHEACIALVEALEAAREAIPDDEWDAATDGPFADILSAAMDVEYYTDKCNVS